jgi:BlaI family penicillinase repressor
MKPAPRISETEWEVMRVIWERHPVTAAEVIARLSQQDPTWHPKTIRTFLARLVQKGVLGYVARGRCYVYEPRLTQRACAADATESFLGRVFGGSLRPMLAHFVQQRKLSRREIEDLKRILEGKEE